MIPFLLILIPLLTGLAAFFIKSELGAKNWALLSSIITLMLALGSVSWYNHPSQLSFDAEWIPILHTRFSLTLDGLSKMLSLLTAISLPLVIVSTYKNKYSKPNNFYGLLLLSQAGLLGVFLSVDALLFYFFWELALIPVYFLCSQWGGEKRIQVTFKFFVYTFLGSLLMLIGILYVYFKTPDHSFALQSFYHVKLGLKEEFLGFWLFFIAFAIKMPIFPFHTWQPDTYEQSPTAVTMILSGVMVKMGLFGVIRWLLPVFPHALLKFDQLIIILSITGVLYASFIAIRQDDFKRLIAYSSIAHIGLMSAALFSSQQTGIEGVLVQMFNHGINVIGLWIVADVIEKQLGTRKFSELGGMAQKAPILTTLLVVLAFANIALPLTNSFVGEFLMFNGLFQYNFWVAAVAGLSIILAAVYTLNMIQKIFYGHTVSATENAVDSSVNVNFILVLVLLTIIVLGVFPQPLIELTKDTVQTVLTKIHTL